MPSCSCEPTNSLRRARCRRCGPQNRGNIGRSAPCVSRPSLAGVSGPAALVVATLAVPAPSLATLG